jgi:hypothetical protein
MINTKIKEGSFCVLNAVKLKIEAPWSFDWGVNKDVIVYVNKINGESSADVFFHHYMSGVVPVSCLTPFDKQKI